MNTIRRSGRRADLPRDAAARPLSARRIGRTAVISTAARLRGRP
ncbi:hypothetical protein [Streptomyces sp. NPDC020141]